MRKKTITKIVACACVAAMAVSFAACGKEKKPTDPSNSDPSTSDVSDVSATDAPTAAPDTTAPANNGGATNPAAPPAATGPTDTASAVKFYNDGVAKIGSVSATVTRALVPENCKVKVVVKDVLLTELSPEAPAEFALTDAPLEGAALYALDAASVTNTAIAESGDNYVITFKLADANFDSTSTPGTGGYMYFLDVNTVNDTVVSIGQKLTGGNMDLEIKKEQATLFLHDSTFVVTMSKAGNIVSAELSFTEDVKGSIKTSLLGPVAVPANVQGKGTAKYTVS